MQKSLKMLEKKSNSLIDAARQVVDNSNVDTRTPMNVELTVTDECNCRCEYCFEDCKPRTSLKPEIQQKMLELVVDLCQRFDVNEHSFLNFSFWGGEPFMNEKFMKLIVDQTKKYDFVKYHVYTNGILSDQLEDFAKFAVENNIAQRMSVQFSYDGEPHNSIKRHNDGKVTIANAQKYIEAGFNVNFKATLSYDMVSKLPQIWDSYKQLHDEIGSIVSYSPTLDMAKADYSYFSQWKNAVKEIVKKEKNFIIDHGYPLMSWLNDYQKRSCNIDYSVHMHSDGNMYICHGCPYSKNSCSKSYGSFIEASSLIPYLSRHEIAEDNEICRKCGAAYCASCHIMHLNGSSLKQNISQWNICKSASKSRCMYYQYFSYMTSALRYALIHLR